MAVAVAPAGDVAAYVHGRAEVRLVDARTGAPLGTLAATPLPDTIRRLAFDRTGSRLAAVSPFHGIRVWDLRAVRSHLAGMGLDWPGPRPPPAPTARPITRVELDPTGINPR